MFQDIASDDEDEDEEEESRREEKYTSDGELKTLNLKDKTLQLVKH